MAWRIKFGLISGAGALNVSRQQARNCGGLKLSNCRCACWALLCRPVSKTVGETSSAIQASTKFDFAGSRWDEVFSRFILYSGVALQDASGATGKSRIGGGFELPRASAFGWL